MIFHIDFHSVRRFCKSKRKRKPVAPQSEIGNLGRLQLQLQFVSDKGDEFRIGGLALCGVDGVAEEALEGIQIPSVPCHFDGVTDGPFHTAGGGLEGFGDLGVQDLGDGVDGVPTAHQTATAAGGFIALFVALDNYCLLAYTNDTKSRYSGQA